MNTVKVSGSLGGSIKAIASKSHAHRLLISAALSDAETNIICTKSSSDIDATANCLRAAGARIDRTDDAFKVSPIEQINGSGILDCGESGATLRILLPVIFALGGSYEIKMAGRLPERPLSPLDRELAAHGCTIEGIGTDTLKCTGKLKHGKFTLPGNVTSQFISGLLFALPLLTGDSSIQLTNKLESKTYVDMTVDVLSRFGIDIKCLNNDFTKTESNSMSNSFVVRGGQKYRSPGRITAEGDWSNAAFWLCAGAIGKEKITCTGLDHNSKQGDKAIADLLKRFGASVKYDDDSVSVSPGELRGIEIDAQDITDIVPIISVVASVARGKTEIRNAGRLRIKESDRLHTVTEILNTLGADVAETETGLIINGRPHLQGGCVSSHQDHRIAMAAAIAGTVCKSEVVITNAATVSKSYPEFFNDFAALGGTAEEVYDVVQIR